jgi:hypothetical protein
MPSWHLLVACRVFIRPDRKPTHKKKPPRKAAAFKMRSAAVGQSPKARVRNIAICALFTFTAGQ